MISRKKILGWKYWISSPIIIQYFFNICATFEYSLLQCWHREKAFPCNEVFIILNQKDFLVDNKGCQALRRSMLLRKWKYSVNIRSIWSVSFKELLWICFNQMMLVTQKQNYLEQVIFSFSFKYLLVVHIYEVKYLK